MQPTLSKVQKALLVKIENEVLSGDLSSLTNLIAGPKKAKDVKKKVKSGSMQEKTLDLISSTIEKYGFDVMKVSDWSNTGKLSIQKKNAFGELGKVVYDFQSDTLTLSITIGDKKILSQPPRQDYFSFYMRHTDVKAFETFMKSLEVELKALK